MGNDSSIELRVQSVASGNAEELRIDRGIKDFAGLYTIDEPSTEIPIRSRRRQWG